MMTQNPSHDDHAITLDAHLESLRKALHDAQQARKEETLTPDAMQEALTQLASNLRRDFPQQSEIAVLEASMQDLLDGYWARVKDQETNAPTGLGRLDDVLNGGFQRKRLVVLLGAPGSGKTSLANQIAEHVASVHPVLYVTSEDTPDVLLAKTLARVGQMKYSAALYGWERERERIIAAIQAISAHPSAKNLRYVDASMGLPAGMDDIRQRARAHFADKPGPGLLVVDYLQRLARTVRDAAGIRDLREAVTMLTEQLRAMACELDCSVLAIASMNRASGYGRTDASALSSAKESGDIEYTADVIMALTEETGGRKAPPGMAPRALRIDKNRQGETSILALDWYADRQQFTVADRDGR